jgi:1-acyl-sn-glycerol-3-phosphate acyltransferase
LPIFGWLLRGAGFLSPEQFSQGKPLLDRVARHLRAGGNLLVFPEGTRSRDGKLAPFKKGAFYLARVLAAPILVLRVRGTNHLFAPGRLTFDTTASEPIEVRQLAVISASDADTETSLELAQQVRHYYEDA